jgi:hypothetical protein
MLWIFLINIFFIMPIGSIFKLILLSLLILLFRWLLLNFISSEPLLSTQPLLILVRPLLKLLLKGSLPLKKSLNSDRSISLKPRPLKHLLLLNLIHNFLLLLVLILEYQLVVDPGSDCLNRLKCDLGVAGVGLQLVKNGLHPGDVGLGEPGMRVQLEKGSTLLRILFGEIDYEGDPVELTVLVVIGVGVDVDLDPVGVLVLQHLQVLRVDGPQYAQLFLLHADALLHFIYLIFMA